MRVATAQINLTIRHLFLYEPLSTPQNLSPARTHNPIYHQPHKTINFLSKAISSFGISKNPK